MKNYGRLIFRKQFLLTKKNLNDLADWKKVRLDTYQLYTHPDLETTIEQKEHSTLVLLGDLFDYELVNKSNKELLSTITIDKDDNIDIINKFDRFSGTYIIICLNTKTDEFFVFNDATAQREIYYYQSTNFGKVLASQPKLIGSFFSIEIDTRPSASDFYGSKEFNTKKAYVGEKTEFTNVWHLKPNHYLDLKKDKIIRFYPIRKLKNAKLEDSAKNAAIRIRGFLEAASYRYKILLPVSAGWDSRVLFAASKRIQDKCHYYIFKFPNDSDNHPDIKTAKQLLRIANRKLEVVPVDYSYDDNLIEAIERSISYPNFEKLKYVFGYWANYPDHVSVIGNVSEIGRTEWPDIYFLDEN